MEEPQILLAYSVPLSPNQNQPQTPLSAETDGKNPTEQEQDLTYAWGISRAPQGRHPGGP